MHTAARQRQHRWISPRVGAAGHVGRTWLSAPALVGLGADDPGNWMQDASAQEKKQGYKKTDVVTLQIQCGQLRAKVDELMANVDAAATDPGSLSYLKKLQFDAVTLEGKVTALANGTSTFSTYGLLKVQYQALAAQFASLGIEEAAPPPAASSNPASPPIVQAPTVVKPPAPGAPTITTKSKSGEWDWLLYGAGALAVLGVLIGTKVVKL